MRHWNEKTIDWYLRAGKYSQYPDKILAEIIPSLRPSHTVLDIGSGPGLYALAIAPLVKDVLAMDRLGTVLKELGILAQNRGLSNIHCLESSWPDIEIQDQVDIIISAFSSSRVMNTEDSIEKMLDLNPETIFLVAPGKYSHPFAWTAHNDGHPDAKHTQGILEQMKVDFSTKHIVIDFGQPVRNLSEATDFLAGFLRISAQAARRHAEKIGRSHTQGIYLPNSRNVVLIKIVKS